MAKLIIGVTGEIATGKSRVMSILKEEGVYTIDTDDLVHRMMSRGEPLYNSVVDKFGPQILKGKAIDRRELARIVFRDPEALYGLERIVFPRVIATVRHLIDASTNEIIAIEAVKLIESGLATQCNSVWLVVASHDTQMRRLKARGLSTDDALARLRMQPLSAIQTLGANTVIDNDTDSYFALRQVIKYTLTDTKLKRPE